MGFVKTPKELEELRRTSFDFYDAEFLAVFWETKPEIVEHLLPPPLKPVKHPVVQAFIANYPKTNFGVIYKEAALFLFGEYDGVVGIHCLAMPVDKDMALIGGREVFGYPKKISYYALFFLTIFKITEKIFKSMNKLTMYQIKINIDLLNCFHIFSN